MSMFSNLQVPGTGSVQLSWKSDLHGMTTDTCSGSVRSCKLLYLCSNPCVYNNNKLSQVFSQKLIANHIQLNIQ